MIDIPVMHQTKNKKIFMLKKNQRKNKNKFNIIVFIQILSSLVHALGT